MTVPTVQFQKAKKVLSVSTALDLSGKRHHCVSLTDNLVSITPEGEIPWGILQNDPVGPKQQAGVITDGLSKVKLGASCNQFDNLGPDANGALVPQENGIVVAQEAGEAGDLIDAVVGTIGGGGVVLTKLHEWYYDLLLDVPAGQAIPIAAFQGRGATTGDPPIGTIVNMEANLGLQIFAAGALVAMNDTAEVSLHADCSPTQIVFGHDLRAGQSIIIRVTE